MDGLWRWARTPLFHGSAQRPLEALVALPIVAVGLVLLVGLEWQGRWAAIITILALIAMLVTRVKIPDSEE